MHCKRLLVNILEITVSISIKETQKMDGIDMTHDLHSLIYDDKGELERYNVFHASMLVRHSNDGKLYLYDVIDIKKETSNSLSE